MDPFLQDRMEDYLAGRLSGADQERFEALLAKDSDAGGIVEGFRDTSALFEAIIPAPHEVPQLDPAFYARLRQTIEKEDEIPFWAALLEPFMMKRVAFAALMWLFALGSLTILTDQTPQRNTELADMILNAQPPAQYNVRMGPDLEQNRDSMLTVMMASAEGR